MENSTGSNLTFTQQEEGVTIYPTNTTDDDGYNGTLRAFHVFSAIIYSVVFLLGTTGNGLVIFFTAFKMKRSVNVVWFLNLAIADFIFSSFLPFKISHIALGFHWPFGTSMCMLNNAITFVNLYASIFLLTVISIDRCASVMFPIWCLNHRNPRLASFVALAVWILAFLFSLPHFIFRDTDDYEGHVTCYDNYHMDYDIATSMHRNLIITRLIISFIIPFTLIVSCYTFIMIRIRGNCMNTSSRTFKIILAVIILFFICWFPYHVFSFLELAVMYPGNDHLYDVIRAGQPFTSSLYSINSCINPFLYVFMVRDFKTKFCRSMQSVLEKAFMEETSPTSFRSKTTVSQTL